MSELVDIAASIAAETHDGQTDKGGRPYLKHPMHVAGRMAGDDLAQAVAWLHDAIEDTDLEPADLLVRGVPFEVVDAVGALTQLPGEPRDLYYERVRANPLALRAKVDGDIADNLDLERLSQLDSATQDRLRAKYTHALDLLTG